MDADELLARLTAAAQGRTASALVSDDEHTLEVSVADGGRWVVRSWNTEWVQGADELRCWHLVPAGGASEVAHGRPAGRVHPVVGLLRPALLTVWGREADGYRPTAVLDGLFGPAQVVLAAPGSDEAVGTLHVDARRWLCTALELPGRTWSLTEYRAEP